MSTYEALRGALEPFVENARLDVNKFRDGLREILTAYPGYTLVTALSDSRMEYAEFNVCDRHLPEFIARPEHDFVDPIEFRWVCTCDHCDTPTLPVFTPEDFACYCVAYASGVRHTPEQMRDWLNMNLDRWFRNMLDEFQEIEERKKARR